MTETNTAAGLNQLQETVLSFMENPCGSLRLRALPRKYCYNLCLRSFTLLLQASGCCLLHHVRCRHFLQVLQLLC